MLTLPETPIATAQSTDRFGLGWRDELSAGILAHLDRIEVIEVIADDWLDAPNRRVQALATLARQVPVLLHGVGLGPASTAMVDERRLAALARLVERVGPQAWSEHLAFVRAGGTEIGHLAAPPRTPVTVEGAARNLSRAAAVVGARPLVENVATLIDPPASTMDEISWTCQVLEASGCDFLLDLHNLYANATNFGCDPFEYIAALPADRIAQIHLAGGRWIARGAARRRLDDHLHDVPEPVFDLLDAVGAHASQPLAILIERDGCYPAIDDLLRQLDRAREALASGRRRRARTA
jgi:hypothetical protein